MGRFRSWEELSMRRWLVVAAVGVVGGVVGCGGDDAGDAGESRGAGGATGGGAGVDGGSGASGAGGAAGASGSGGAGGGGAASPIGRCGDPVPPGAATAATPRPYTGGTCPTLPRVTTENVALQSRGAARSFYLALPADLRNDETLPVIFLWHWLGGSARSFFERGEIQAAVDSQRFIAVMPEKKGDLAFTWPYSLIDGVARMEEEFAFFDDMLSCVSEQFNVDANCVSSAGVSAGALFTAQLAGFRGDYLASFISLSGGVGGVIKPWTQPEHRMPALVLNGGPTDNCLNLLNFQQQSRVLEDALTSGGHFLVECVHNCGHAVPPFEGEAGFSKFQFLWDFAMDHPFWLPAGRSVYESTGLPSATPDWCGIGRGGATPRTGECTDSSEC